MADTTNGNMSRKTYSCYVCEKNGFPDERVFLAGKDENGKTIYIAEDGVTRHQHKRKEGGTNNTLPPTNTDTIISLLRDIDSKLNRLLAIEGQ